MKIAIQKIDKNEGTQLTFKMDVDALLETFYQECANVTCVEATKRTQQVLGNATEACEASATAAAAAVASAAQWPIGADTTATENAVLEICLREHTRLAEAAYVDCVDHCLDTAYDARIHAHFPAGCTQEKDPDKSAGAFWNKSKAGCVQAASKPRPGQQRYAEFTQLNGRLTTGVRAVATVLMTVAAWRWNDPKRSRPWSLAAFKLHATFCFIEAILVPWYSAMDFDGAIDATQTDGMPDIVHASVTEALKVEYRAKVATAIHVKGSAVVQAIAPCACMSMMSWKSLFPESSVWILGTFAFPVLAVFTTIGTMSIYNQLFSNWKFVVFCFFASTSNWYYILLTPVYGAHRESDPATVMAKTKKIKMIVHYPWLLVELVFGIAFLWPLFMFIGNEEKYNRSDGIDGDMDDFAARYLAHHWGRAGMSVGQ